MNATENRVLFSIGASDSAQRREVSNNLCTAFSLPTHAIGQSIRPLSAEVHTEEYFHRFTGIRNINLYDMNITYNIICNMNLIYIVICYIGYIYMY